VKSKARRVPRTTRHRLMRPGPVDSGTDMFEGVRSTLEEESYREAEIGTLSENEDKAT
jgi:hypothetical protein